LVVFLFVRFVKRVMIQAAVTIDRHSWKTLVAKTIRLIVRWLTLQHSVSYDGDVTSFASNKHFQMSHVAHTPRA